MNYQQKKLVTSWLCVAALLLAGIIFNDWVMSNWDWLSYVLIGVIGVAGALFGKEKLGWGKPGVMFGEFIKPYPLLQLWMAVWTICIAVVLLTLGLKGIRLDKYAGTLLIAFFLPLLGPAIAVAEMQRYKRLGVQSNKRLQSDEATPRA